MINKEYKIVTALYLIVLLSLSTIINAASIKFKNLSVQDGLSSPVVHCTFVDSYGFLWIGSNQGVDRFDGFNVESYKSYLPKKSIGIFSLKEDTTKNMWIGTNSGLFWWDRKSNLFDQFTQHIDSNEVITTIHKHQNNKLFIVSPKKIVSIDPLNNNESKIIYHNQQEGIEIKDIVFKENFVFILTNKQILKYNYKTHSYTTINLPFEINNNKKVSITLVNNLIYFGIEDIGLHTFNTKTNEFSTLQSLKQKSIISINSNKRHIYVGTNYDGLYKLDINNLDVLDNLKFNHSDPYSISSNSIHHIQITNNDFITLSTYAGGVSYSTLNFKGLFDEYKIQGESPAEFNMIRSIYLDNQIKFVGTRNGLYVIKNENDYEYFTKTNSQINSQIVLRVFPYKDEYLIGTYNGGISSYKNNKLTDWRPDLFDSKSIYDFELFDNNLWIASLDGLFKVDKNGESLHFTSNNSPLINDLVFNIKTDTLNRIWVGTMDGLAIYNHKNEELELISKLNELPNSKVTYIYLDSKKQIWICYEHEGIFCLNYNLEVVDRISTINGLSDNSIAGFTEYESGNYWITTLNGLNYYNQENASITKYGVNYGMVDQVFNQGAILIDENETMWLGAEKGLIQFKLNSFDKLNDDLNIVISNISYNDKISSEIITNTTSLDEISKIQIPSSKGEISFRAINLNIKKNTPLSYITKLERKNAKGVWTKTILENNNITFKDLKPGNYKFYIAAPNTKNEPISETIITVPFVVKNTWYWDARIYALTFFILLIIIAIWYTYKTINKKRTKVPTIKIEEEPKITPEVTVDDKYNNSTLSKEESAALYKELNIFMDESKIYLQLYLKINTIATKMNRRSRDISQAINQNSHQNFNDYVNQFRIKEVIERVKNPKNVNYNYTAIAEECGFSSRSSFFRAFKKMMDCTPASYFENLKN